MQLNERLGDFISMVEYERSLAPNTVWQKELAALFNPVLYRDDAFHRIEKELDWIEMTSGQGAIDSP